jgi:hypothetical protein
MQLKIMLSALSISAAAAAYLFGVRLTLIEVPASTTLREIIHDGGPVQQIWTGFSATITAYVGPLLALLILGFGATFFIYLIFRFALKLAAKLANEAVQTVLNPIARAANIGKNLAAGGAGIAKDGAGRVAEAAKAGVGGVAVAKNKMLAMVGFPIAAKPTPEIPKHQIEDARKQ